MRFRTNNERGATALQLLIILVPVLFGLMGFALDLGILYSVKGDLKTAASSAALAAAQNLIGTDTSADAATAASQLTTENATGFGNRYYFHGLPIGLTTGNLISTISDPAYFSTAAEAIANPATLGGGTSSSLARYVRVSMTGQTQLLFWSFIPIVNDRILTVSATAVAGISAPLCTACGIEPFAVAAITAADTTDFGYIIGTKYSLAYLCTGIPPAILPGATQTISYVLLNRLDTAALVFPDESSQSFRDGAGGLPGNANSAQACFLVNNTENIWASAVVNSCGANQVAPVVTDALCGLDSRFESTPQTTCSGITSIDTLSTIYQPDTDVNNYDAYTDYTGNGRRIITIPVVDIVSGTASMTVLGFRQFLLIPVQGGSNLTVSDPLGRFVAMYIGSVAPVPQGRFDGCQQTAGPGKVVLHQ